MKKKIIGRYIITDPEICHGKPTFRGTRIMVWQVLEQVARGMAWETIEEEWRGKVTRQAIAEAVQLASQAFAEHADEYTFILEPA
ncbi:MAG: DUF433 domain-containing protein [Caldilineaceae bacterium]